MKAADFFKRNYIALIIGALFYVVYLKFTYAGNRICDCEKTEKYAPLRTGYRGVRTFYHK